MGVDYYKILQVDRNAKADDLKRAFKQISEAYDVLTNPRKRAIYDQHGEEGLKRQAPADGGPTALRLDPRDANHIFREFFGTGSPSGGSGTDEDGGRGKPSRLADDVFSQFFDASPRPQKAATIENRLPCSLEELYKGTTKKMKISRDILHISGRTMPVEEILTIDIKPGWKKGTKITFEEKGNESPNVIPADIVFTIDEKPHNVFTREGNDLITTQNISLLEALTGYTVHLTKLDGHSLTIPMNSIILPGYEEVISNKGMPIAKDPSTRGNLIIKFNIRYPTMLTMEQKAGFRRLLAP